MKAPHSRDVPPNLKERLVEIAGRLLETTGIEGVTLRAVAQDAGVSHMAPYRHFAGKDALLAAVAERGFEALMRAMDARRACPGGIGDAATATGVAYVVFALDNPALYRLMFGHNLAPRDRFPGLVRAGQAAFQRCIEVSEKRRGRRRGGECQDAGRNAAAGLWALVHGLSSLAIDGLIHLPSPGPGRDRAIANLLAT